MGFEYQHVALGGTFDRLHVGHRKLLELGFGVSTNVVIGVTCDGFSPKKTESRLILSYEERVGGIEGVIKEHGWAGRQEIVEIDDVMGTTLVDDRLEALVVSQQTLGGAKIVNQERKKVGLVELPVKVAEMVADGCGVYVSSTRIRKGLVNRGGVCYRAMFGVDLGLTTEQRESLKKPMERLVAEDKIGIELSKIQPHKVAVVGDRTLANFLKHNYRFDYGVFDGKTRRNKYGVSVVNSQKPTHSASNLAGHIEANAVGALAEMVEDGSGLLRVDGEEDLLVLPMVLMLPLGSLVVYGQPDKGVVFVCVSEESKEKWYKFLMEG